MHIVQVFKGKTSSYPRGVRKWYVRLVSSNGKTLSISQGYVTKWNAKRAAKKNFPEAELKVLDS